MRYFKIGDKVKTDHGTATVVCFEHLGSKSCPIYYENPTHPENVNSYRVGMQLDDPELWFGQTDNYFEHPEFLAKLNE